MRARHLGLGRTRFDWSKDDEPEIVVQPGDELVVEMLDASAGQLAPEATLSDFVNMDQSVRMPISGPVYVEGAKPGDVLQVDLITIDPGDFGWTGQRAGQGVLPAEDFPSEWLHMWHIDGMRARFREGISVPLEPFPGMMGVAPTAPGRHDSLAPRRVGGNLDTKQLVAGSTLYLPIEVDGGLFGIGDGHAAQGDGEVCGSAIEVPMTVRLRLSLRRDFTLNGPEFEVKRPLERKSAAAAGYYATTGVHPDLFTAAQMAVRAMVDHLADRHGLDPQDAYGLCSVAADLKISEMVDLPNMVVSLFLSYDIFDTQIH